MAVRWRAVAVVLAAGMAVAGCSGGGTGGSTADASILGMVRLAPADSDTVTIDLYQQAAAGLGVPAPSARAAARYFATLNQRGGVPGSEITQAFGVDTTGVNLADVRADLSAGSPPDDVLAALGTFDTKAIDRAAHADPAWHSALTTRQDDGVIVYSWLRDNQDDLSRGTGILSQVPGSRRLAVVDQTLLLTRNDATMHRSLDTATGHGGSYADKQGATDVAAQLDRMHAYAATLTSRQAPVAAVLGGRSVSPAQVAVIRQRMAGQVLRPYQLAGIGVTRLRGRPAMLVVLASADNATAQANATTLKATVQHGISLRANQPWSELLTVDDVHADGKLTIATFTESASPATWSQIVQNDDSLLLTP
jgi:hypothetical protein